MARKQPAQWPEWTNMFNQTYRVGDWIFYPRGSGRGLTGKVTSIVKERRDGTPIIKTWTDMGDPVLLRQARALNYRDPGYHQAWDAWNNSKVTHQDPWAVVHVRYHPYEPDAEPQGNLRTLTEPEMVIKIDPPL